MLRPTKTVPWPGDPSLDHKTRVHMRRPFRLGWPTAKHIGKRRCDVHRLNVYAHTPCPISRVGPNVLLRGSHEKALVAKAGELSATVG
jgi:hypothetical protein